MKCMNCNNENPDNAAVCSNCGSDLRNQNRPQKQFSENIHSDGMDYTPISMWGYVGYNILFGIPLVGFIMMLVFSFGGTRNVNLRNYARSFLCVLLIVLILVAILFIISIILAAITGVALNDYYGCIAF